LTRQLAAISTAGRGAGPVILDHKTSVLRRGFDHGKDVATILRHTDRMPDEHPITLPRRAPEHADLGAIKSDLEFLMERVAQFPTRRELAPRPLYVMIGGVGLVIALFERASRTSCCITRTPIRLSSEEAI
jgi:hypothetical protein